MKIVIAGGTGVDPKLLTNSGFAFEFPEWKDAAADLCRRWRADASEKLKSKN